MELRRIYINNTKIANEIRKYDDLPGHRNFVKVSGSDKSLESVYMISDNLSGYDCAVADAVYTLYKNDYTPFSERQILQALSGDEAQTLTRQKKEEIADSLKRLCGARIAIDCGAEMRARGKIGEGEEMRLTGPYLTLRPEGRKYSLDHVRDMPLYRYAEMNRQFISVDPKLLDVTYAENGRTKKLSNTRENILIKRYLIQRLEVMRNPKGASRGRKISYVWQDAVKGESGGMLSLLEISRDRYESAEAWKHKVLYVHNTVTRILDYYRELQYIEEYRVLKGPRGAIRGIEIVGKIRNPDAAGN